MSMGLSEKKGQVPNQPNNGLDKTCPSELVHPAEQHKNLDRISRIDIMDSCSVFDYDIELATQISLQALTTPSTSETLFYSPPTDHTATCRSSIDPLDTTTDSPEPYDSLLVSAKTVEVLDRLIAEFKTARVKLPTLPKLTHLTPLPRGAAARQDQIALALTMLAPSAEGPYESPPCIPPALFHPPRAQRPRRAAATRTRRTYYMDSEDEDSYAEENDSDSEVEEDRSNHDDDDEDNDGDHEDDDVMEYDDDDDEEFEEGSKRKTTASSKLRRNNSSTSNSSLAAAQGGISASFSAHSLPSTISNLSASWSSPRRRPTQQPAPNSARLLLQEQIQERLAIAVAKIRSNPTGNKTTAASQDPSTKRRGSVSSLSSSRKNSTANNNTQPSTPNRSSAKDRSQSKLPALAVVTTKRRNSTTNAGLTSPITPSSSKSNGSYNQGTPTKRQRTSASNASSSLKRPISPVSNEDSASQDGDGSPSKDSNQPRRSQRAIRKPKRTLAEMEEESNSASQATESTKASGKASSSSSAGNTLSASATKDRSKSPPVVKLPPIILPEISDNDSFYSDSDEDEPTFKTSYHAMKVANDDNNHHQANNLLGVVIVPEPCTAQTMGMNLIKVLQPVFTIPSASNTMDSSRLMVPTANPFTSAMSTVTTTSPMSSVSNSSATTVISTPVLTRPILTFHSQTTHPVSPAAPTTFAPSTPPPFHSDNQTQPQQQQQQQPHTTQNAAATVLLSFAAYPDQQQDQSNKRIKLTHPSTQSAQTQVAHQQPETKDPLPPPSTCPLQRFAHLFQHLQHKPGHIRCHGFYGMYGASPCQDCGRMDVDEDDEMEASAISVNTTTGNSITFDPCTLMGRIRQTVAKIHS